MMMCAVFLRGVPFHRTFPLLYTQIKLTLRDYALRSTYYTLSGILCFSFQFSSPQTKYPGIGVQCI